MPLLVSSWAELPWALPYPSNNTHIPCLQAPEKILLSNTRAQLVPAQKPLSLQPLVRLQRDGHIPGSGSLTSSTRNRPLLGKAKKDVLGRGLIKESSQVPDSLASPTSFPPRHSSAALLREGAVHPLARRPLRTVRTVRT